MLGRVLCLIAFILAVSAHQEIPCGLPAFTSRMPQKQSQQLIQVWANYKNGTACTVEQRRTMEIIASLTEEERDAVFDGEGQDGIPVEDQFDTTPDFIKSLSQEVRTGFDAIWMDPQLTDQEKQKKMQAYAQEKFNAEQKVGFGEWLTEITTAKKAVEERISKLSPKAKEILVKLLQIREEERKLMTTITPELGKELFGLI